MTHAEVRRILANADENKDGKLDYNEVATAACAYKNKVLIPKLKVTNFGSFSRM